MKYNPGKEITLSVTPAEVLADVKTVVADAVKYAPAVESLFAAIPELAPYAKWIGEVVTVLGDVETVLADI
jgi:hypothetical protein